jgi:hypothetical protein
MPEKEGGDLWTLAKTELTGPLERILPMAEDSEATLLGTFTRDEVITGPEDGS